MSKKPIARPKGFGCGRQECEPRFNLPGFLLGKNFIIFGVGFNPDTGKFNEPCSICAEAWKKLEQLDTIPKCEFPRTTLKIPECKFPGVK
jgi:hypothetical protein